MKTEITTLEDQWISYRVVCYPPSKMTLSPLQEAEIRQALYAGILLALKIAVESSVNLSEEAAFQNIKNLIENAQTVCRERLYEMKGRKFLVTKIEPGHLRLKGLPAGYLPCKG